MTEPRRWIDEGPPEAIGHLLKAAASETPDDASVTRTLGVLGVGVSVAGAASTAGASTAGAALAAASVGKASGVFALGTFAKWAVLATAVAAAGVAGKAVTSRPAAAPSAAHASTTPVSAPVAAAPMPLPEVAPIAPVAPLALSTQPVDPEPPVVARVAPPSAGKLAPKAAPVAEAPMDAERLAEEVALVDQARGALARGDAAAALRALDEYDARFTERRFAPEALYLRMESLLRAGKTGTARAVAERLAKRFPSSPHTPRARQVLEQTIP